MKVIMNDLRKKVIEVLKESGKPLTLQEIGNILGVDVKSGTTNAMISSGILKVAGKKKVQKISYDNVNTYTIGDLPSESATN